MNLLFDFYLFFLFPKQHCNYGKFERKRDPLNSDDESVDTVSDDLRNLSTGAVNVIKRFGDYTKSSSRLRRQNEESSKNRTSQITNVDHDSPRGEK